MKRLLWGLGFCLLAIAPAQAGTMLGFADKVQSGDTFALCEGRACKTVRICGIEAPRQDDAGFEKSRVGLVALLGGNMIKCTTMGSGTNCDGLPKPAGDAIAVECAIGGNNVAATMVAHNLACDRTADGAYSKSGGEACPKAK